jgi:hypothetical protein
MIVQLIRLGVISSWELIVDSSLLATWRADDSAA